MFLLLQQAAKVKFRKGYITALIMVEISFYSKDHSIMSQKNEARSF